MAALPRNEGSLAMDWEFRKDKHEFVDVVHRNSSKNDIRCSRTTLNGDHTLSPQFGDWLDLYVSIECGNDTTKARSWEWQGHMIFGKHDPRLYIIVLLNIEIPGDLLITYSQIQKKSFL